MARAVFTSVAGVAAAVALLVTLYQASLATAATVTRCAATDTGVCGAFELIDERGGVGYTGG